MRRYLRRCIIAFSIFVNVVGGGRSNQTFSATQYERKKQKRFNVAWLIDLFSFGKKIIAWMLGLNGNLYINQLDILKTWVKRFMVQLRISNI